MRTTDSILKELGSDNIDLTPELLADAAGDPAVLEKLVALCDRAAEKPRSINSYEGNLVRWAPYIFAEVGCPTLIRPLVGLFSLKERLADHLLGGYSAYDAPSIFMRIAGADTPKAFAGVVRAKDAAAELRVAPILASGAAWAHGIIDREAALAPLRAELVRLAKPETAEGESQAWLDTLLDAALDLHPAELVEELGAAAKTWELDAEWEEELKGALADTQQSARLRFREEFPRFDKAVEFVERWEQLDAEIDAADAEGSEGKN